MVMARGMVMAVFTLPSFDVVFKLIKDRFPPSKRTTPEDVQRRYKLVFDHDKVGRLVDAQEFRNLSFRRDRFDEELLDVPARAEAGGREQLLQALGAPGLGDGRARGRRWLRGRFGGLRGRGASRLSRAGLAGLPCVTRRRSVGHGG